LAAPPFHRYFIGTISCSLQSRAALSAVQREFVANWSIPPFQSAAPHRILNSPRSTPAFSISIIVSTLSVSNARNRNAAHIRGDEFADRFVTDSA